MSSHSSDVKGGLVLMKKKKKLHKKANHEKERKANAALLQVINIDEDFNLELAKITLGITIASCKVVNGKKARI